jgi:hypothetical protein
MKIQNKLQTKNIKKIKNIENEATEIDTAFQGDTTGVELTYNTMSHGIHYAEASGLIATDAMLATASTTTATLVTTGLSLGTIGWSALGAVAIGSAVAAAGGGGSSNASSKGQLATLSDPTATAENITLITPDILFSIDEERMARDVYDALYIQTGLKIFDNISDSEQKHYDAVLNSAINLGIETSDLLTAPGIYLNPEIQALYDDLMALGSQSTADALTVGKMIEEVDITDLKEMIDTNPITSLDSVYTNLLNGSYNHLDAFNAQIAII